MSVTVKPIPDGPLMVKGDGIEVQDAQGNPFAVKGDAAYLCRCGASANKPLCDGGHEKIGFKGYARIFDLKGERTGR
ncbi:MAG TPA: CDGSH iron-sulfur domain-containing protein [Methylomirabilota bacterium]|nr:CDGSH iron-sulfur domain-containing protein [Methylomirabilota bacterium]